MTPSVPMASTNSAIDAMTKSHGQHSTGGVITALIQGLPGHAGGPQRHAKDALSGQPGMFAMLMQGLMVDTGVQKSAAPVISQAAQGTGAHQANKPLSSLSNANSVPVAPVLSQLTHVKGGGPRVIQSNDGGLQSHSAHGSASFAEQMLGTAGSTKLPNAGGGDKQPEIANMMPAVAPLSGSAAKQSQHAARAAGPTTGLSAMIVEQPGNASGPNGTTSSASLRNDYVPRQRKGLSVKTLTSTGSAVSLDPSPLSHLAKSQAIEQHSAAQRVIHKVGDRMAVSAAVAKAQVSKPQSLADQTNVGMVNLTATQPSLTTSQHVESTHVVNLSHQDAGQTFSNILVQAGNAGNGQVTVRIHPEGLGSISITARQNGESVVLQVAATSQDTLAWLHQQHSGLEDAVRSAGVNLSSLQLSMANSSTGGQSGQTFRQGQSHSSPGMKSVAKPGVSGVHEQSGTAVAPHVGADLMLVHRINLRI